MKCRGLQGALRLNTVYSACDRELSMKTTELMIKNVPAVLHGEDSRGVYLFVHGQGGSKAESAAFAEIAAASGYQTIGIDLPGHGARRDAENFVPWKVAPELRTVMDHLHSRWETVSLRANSIGAYFSMLALAGSGLGKALFVSPIVDMERLIMDMMGWANVAEERLRYEGEIATGFGQTLSWSYLTWVRENPVDWHTPTEILYAGGDNMTSYETVERFAASHGVGLTVYSQGEHWFHTAEQLAAMREWEQRNI